MKEISFIVHEALVQARSCTLDLQDAEAGVVFGADLSRDEVDPARQSEIHAALIDALSKTAPASHARAFMNALLATVEAVWGNET